MNDEASQPDVSDADFEALLQEFVGQPSGPEMAAPDEVNVPMIRHWCEAAGDANPVYLDETAAVASVHGGTVAPPTMLQAWVMHPFGTRFGVGETASGRLTALLASRGFTSVVATNCEQTYVRYVRPGDRLTMRSTVEAVSGQKDTALGTGHFITTRQDYRDADGELVGSMLFRIIRFRPPRRSPATQAAPSAAATGSSDAAKPPRPAPALTADNTWWFDAVEDGRVLIQRCASCERLRHPPQPMCRSCRSLKWDAVEASGRGTIYSFVITHHPQVPSFDYPLPIVVVELEEGVRMVMNTVDTDIDHIAIGAPVTISIRQADGERKLPFASVASSEDTGAGA
jgi:uncharacterized OB-fold protein/acyl dehydratase